MRVIATIHDGRIPVGTLCELAEAVRPLASDGRVWCAVVDGRISIVSDAAPASVALAPAAPVVVDADNDDDEFRVAWLDNDGVSAAVAKQLGEPLHLVIRTARRLGLRPASAATFGAADGVA